MVRVVTDSVQSGEVCGALQRCVVYWATQLTAEAPMVGVSYRAGLVDARHDRGRPVAGREDQCRVLHRCLLAREKA